MKTKEELLASKKALLEQIEKIEKALMDSVNEVADTYGNALTPGYKEMWGHYIEKRRLWLNDLEHIKQGVEELPD